MNGMNVLIQHMKCRWLAGFVCLLPGILLADGVVANRSLGALEYRAILGQALVQRVEELMEERESLETQLAETHERISKLNQELEQRNTVIVELRDKVAERDEELKKQNQLLSIFRSGSFEYYEVRSGDTLRSIAANPMVYGDAQRAVWLKQANALEVSDELAPGSILIIPRFPEGVIHDL